MAMSIAIGFLVREKAASDGVDSFFVAGRDVPWWLLGTSMVATTFASDTPLAITGWVANYGIAGNWFWWSSVMGTVAMTVFFARQWRSSGVVTDAELVELRYGGPAAATLRTIKALLNATVLNCIVLGWVLAGMAKISEPFMDWQSLLGSAAYGLFVSIYPESLILDSVDNTITIIVLIAVTLTYSSIGGLRAVIITDLFQFAIAMIMSVVLSVLVVRELGGLDAMWTQLATLYPAAEEGAVATHNYLSHEQVSSFIPSFGDSVAGSLGIPFSAFVLTLGVLWWTNGVVDGSGYTAQRMCTAKEAADAERGALWYTFAHFALRSWPWIIVAVAALVMYPRADVDRVAEEFSQCLVDESYCSDEMVQCLDNRYACEVKEYALLYRTQGESTSGGVSISTDGAPVEIFKDDRERGYPALLRDVLPAGLTGLAIAALMAAFMSTVSTQINWGASYLANDVYLRFINPSASNSMLIFVSRLATVLITLLGVLIATQVESIGAMQELFVGTMAGLGLPHLLRWFWWRANAWTEIAGMLTGVSLALGNYLVGTVAGFPDGQMSVLPASMASHPIHVISWVSLASCIAAITATLLTKPTSDEQLKQFVEKVRPMGFWRDHNRQGSAKGKLLQSVINWGLGVFSVYSALFGVGYFLRLEHGIGGVLLITSAITLWLMVRRMGQTQRFLDSQEPLQGITEASG